MTGGAEVPPCWANAAETVSKAADTTRTANAVSLSTLVLAALTMVYPRLPILLLARGHGKLARAPPSASTRAPAVNRASFAVEAGKPGAHNA